MRRRRKPEENDAQRKKNHFLLITLSCFNGVNDPHRLHSFFHIVNPDNVRPIQHPCRYGRHGPRIPLMGLFVEKVPYKRLVGGAQQDGAIQNTELIKFLYDLQVMFNSLSKTDSRVDMIMSCSIPPDTARSTACFRKSKISGIRFR